MRASRRQVLGALATAGVGALVDPGPVLARLAAAVPCSDPALGGQLVGTLPLFRGRSAPQPFGEKIGGPGLDARLVTDLSLLEPGRLITPNDKAYIRTEMPAAARRDGAWLIETTGLSESAGHVDVADLLREARPQGPHLFECSGNANPANFGLMSVAEWDGVPLSRVVERMKPSKGATAVLVNGVDHLGQVSQRSIVGAAWVYPLEALDALGAFLAVRMNGEPVPPDHGKPVRLVVPGWYGCTWIKWVDQVRLVGPDERATSQMVEFAARTHQTEPHGLAREYAPADIQTAATPVRVEMRRGPNGLSYRIVGIVWGGRKAVPRLAIRIGGADQPFTEFDVCPTPKTHTMWNLWDYTWKPTAPGVYDIQLKVPDASVPQRRLDSGYYMRQVTIDEV